MLIDCICFFSFYFRKPTSKKGAIFFLHGLGDLIISGNSINVFSKYIRNKNLQSILFVEPNLVDFCKQYLDVDAVEAISRKKYVRNFMYRIKIASQITRQFSVAIQPNYNRQLFVEDSLTRLASYGERLGNAGNGLYRNPIEKFLGDSFYNNLIDLSEKPVHEIIRNKELFEMLNIPYELNLFNFPDKKIRVLDFNIFNLSLQRPYMLVAPTSSHSMKTWPLDRFIASAVAIATKFNYDIIFVGNDPIKLDLEINHNKFKIINYCGQTSLNDLIVLVKNAKFVLGNDSGIFHMSVALGTPVLAIGGGGMPKRFFPYPTSTCSTCESIDHPMSCFGCGWNCKYHIRKGEAARCLINIGVDDVVRAGVKLLGKFNKLKS